eukprot:83105_1
MTAPEIATWFNRKLIKNSRHKDSAPVDCPAVNRVRIVLEHYHGYIESNSGLNGINNNRNRGVGMYIYISRTLPNYSIVKLLNDYHHILEKYYNQFSTINKILCNNILYDITTSLIFARNNRNRQHCAIKNDIRCEYYGGYNASEEVSIQKIMDKIYCHLILSFDAGYVLNQNEILQIATQQIEESKEIMENIYNTNKEQERDDAVDNPLKMIVNITRKKSQLLNKIRGEKRRKYNKFVSHYNNEESKSNASNTYEIEFGYQFKYWKSYSNNKWYIKSKYINLKSEMTLNKLCKISDKQFEDDIKNAIAYINCRRGRKLKCKYLRENYNEPTQDEIKILPNSCISIDHMLSLMMFCNYDIIRKNIINVYNKLKGGTETDDELKLRHSEYFNVCKLLYECIRLYGTNISKYDGFQMTFYHAFNKQIYFDEFHSYFYYPTSTTTSLNVINVNCPSDGLILQLKKDIEYQGDQHYFDCSWFSDYGIESEKLFLNIMLSFKSILYPKLYHNYSQYLNAFNVLQSMIIGSELNYNILTPLIPKFLSQIIFKKLNKIPKYIYELFQTFRETIDNIQINVWLMIIDSYEIMDDIMDDMDDMDDEYNNNNDRPPNDGNQYGFLKLHSLFIQSDGWIYIDRLLLLFPNTKHIQLYNGNVQTGQILPCITLDESTMNNLLNILDNKYIKQNTNITKISFYYPDEQLLSIQTILKHFTQWFNQIKWNIKFIIKKAPFLPDKCKPVRTLIVQRQ